jgi:hypothetical protein
MKKLIFIIILFLQWVMFKTFAQSFHVDKLFNSGTTFGAEHLFPSAINDSTDFQIIKYKFQYVKPLKTKLGIDLKDFDFNKIDAKASQIFLTTKFDITRPSESHANYFEKIYKVEMGITAITASLRNGIWVYSANIYIEENKTTLQESLTPNFRGYTAYINIKNLKFIYFFGAGLVINQGKFYPVPVFGFRKKISSKLIGEFIVPVHVKLNYKLNKKITLDLASYYSGINAIYREGSAFQNNDNTINLRQFKTYLALNTNIGKHYKIKAELGYSYMQEIDDLNSDISKDMESAPYVNISFHYHFGKSVFGKFINRRN